MQAKAPVELWGEAMRRASDCTNSTPRKIPGHSTPTTPNQATGTKTKTLAPWGSYCIYLMPKQLRDNKISPVAYNAIYCGPDPDYPNCSRVVPYSYNTSTGNYTFERTQVMATIRTFETFFPLKSLGNDLAQLENMT